MSQVKEVGIIGQQYSERNTGKTGILESRDDKCKTLMMIDSEGKGFSISYASFRSKWRKVPESVEESVVDESVEAPESVESSETEEPANIYENLMIEPSKIIDDACIIIGEDNYTCMIWRNGFKSEHCIFVNDDTRMLVTVTKELLEYFKPEEFGAEFIDESSFAKNYEVGAKEFQSFTTAVIDAINRR